MILAMLTLSLSVSSQEVKQQGTVFKVEKQKKEQTEPTATGYTIEVDGISYPIYKGKRGGYYYIVVIKGEEKKKYVPAEVKQKLKEAGV